MNKLIVPPSPNWYGSYTLACAPDNTVIYGSRNEIIVIHPKPPEEPADIRLIAGIHNQRVTSVVVNPNWGNPEKLAVSAAEDNVVRLLDIETCTSKLAHVGHTTRSDKIVGATFAGNEKVVSVSEDGFIIIWRLGTNQLTSLNDIFGQRVKVSCMASNPHVPWMIAFGLKKGVILVTDLRKTGRVLLKLSGHQGPVISLSWCPAPGNLFPKKIKKVKQSSSAKTKTKAKNSRLQKSDDVENQDSVDVKSSKEVLALDETEAIADENIALDEAAETVTVENVNEIPEVNDKPPFDKDNEDSNSKGQISNDEQSHDNQEKISIPIQITPEFQITSTDYNLLKFKDEESAANGEVTHESAENIKQDVDNVVNEETPPPLNFADHENENQNIVNGDNSSTQNLQLNGGESSQSNLLKFKDEESAANREVTQESAQHIKQDIDDVVNEETPPPLNSADHENENQSIVNGDNSSTQNLQLNGGDSSQSNLLKFKDEESAANGEVTQESAENVKQDVDDVVNEETPPPLNSADYENENQSIVNDDNSSTQNLQLNGGESSQSNLLKFKEEESAANGEVTQESAENIKQDVDDVVNDGNQSIVNGDNSSTQNLQLNGGESSESNAIVKDPEQCEDLTINEDVLDKPSTSKESTEISEEVSEITPTKVEYLLASTGRGSGTIKFWRAGTDGILQTELFTPCKQRNGQKSMEKSWVTTCWVTPRDFLSSSQKGELLHWRLSTAIAKDGSSNKWRLIHNDHHKQLFCIAAPIRKYESVEDEDWKDKNLLNAWTMGKDRFILNTSLAAERQSLASYPTIGGIVTCFAASPIDPTRIAFGPGDGTCRIWDLSRPHLQRIIMTQLCDRTPIKITSLCWHPQKEVCLAFGTADGRVGLLDTSSSSKAPTFLVQSTNGAVYKLEWGPLNADLEYLGLYVVSSGNLMAYDIKKPLHEPTKLEFIENCATHFAWKPDYSILAIGTKTGYVLLYSPKFEPVGKLLLQNKAIRWMTWHPEGTPEQNWLAVCTNSIIVYDCSLINQAEDKEQKVGYEEYTKAIFSDHTHYVQCLAWSPHEGGMLASAGEDGTALVWNVKTKTLLYSCISPNFDILNTVIWSPIDPDYIITGGRDCMIQIWKLSENLPQQKSNKKIRHKILRLQEGEATSSGTNSTEVPQKIESPPRKPIRKYLLSGLAQTQNPNFPSALLNDCKRLYELYHESTQNGNAEPSETEEPKFDVLQLFGDRQDVGRILQLEKVSHQNKNQALYMESISMWQGDIGETIKNAMVKGTLNPWLVAAAPMVSFSLWQEACEAYAKQLSEISDSRSVEAAYFYLSCHKVEEAIDVLCNASHFREALIVAKCRLQPDDPIITNIIENWAKFCAAVGNFEIAAQCYIVIGQLEEATKILFRRTNVSTLKFCLELAERCDNTDLVEAVRFRLNTFTNNPPTSEVEELVPPLLSRAELELLEMEERLERELQNGYLNEAAGGDTANKVNGESSDIGENGNETIAGDGQCPLTSLDEQTHQNGNDVEEI